MKRFDVGARVMEPTYGLGSVIAVEDAYTRVQFDEHGMKKFLTSMSKLEPSDEPAPPGDRHRLDRTSPAGCYGPPSLSAPAPRVRPVAQGSCHAGRHGGQNHPEGIVSRARAHEAPGGK